MGECVINRFSHCMQTVCTSSGRTRCEIQKDGRCNGVAVVLTTMFELPMSMIIGGAAR